MDRDAGTESQTNLAQNPEGITELESKLGSRATPPPDKKPDTESIGGLRELYLLGELTRAETSIALAEMGVDQDVASKYLTAWDREMVSGGQMPFEGQEPEVGIPRKPENGRISLAGADSVNRNDPAWYQIAYVADEELVGKKVLIAVKQTISVDQRIQDLRTFSTGRTSGTSTGTVFVPLTVEKEGRKTLTLTSIGSIANSGAANVAVIHDNSVRSAIEVVIVSSEDRNKVLSNVLTLKLAGNTSGIPQNDATDDQRSQEPKAKKSDPKAARELSLAKQLLKNEKSIGKAKKRLESIVAAYPETEAAAEAKELLEDLK